MKDCHCRRCNDKPIPWFVSPSMLADLLRLGFCIKCGSPSCPHGKDHDAMCHGSVYDETDTA